MVNKINSSSHTSFKSNYLLSDGLNSNEELMKIKKETIQSQQDKKYLQEKKENKAQTIGFGIAGILCAIGAVFSKNKRTEWTFGTILAGAGTFLSYIFKPKKENYDKQVVNDIKKGMENENIANK